MEIKPTSCPECQSKGPFSLNTEQVSPYWVLFSCALINQYLSDRVPQLSKDHAARESRHDSSWSIAAQQRRNFVARFDWQR